MRQVAADPGDERRRRARAGPGDLAGVTAVRGQVLGERADRGGVLAPVANGTPRLSMAMNTET